MKIDGVSIKPGNVLEHQGKLWVVTKTGHVKPGKGGAFNQVEMKCITDGTKLNERFRSDEKVEKVRLDLDDYQYLYEEGESFVFMHTESYEQITIEKDLIDEDRAKFLQDSMIVQVESYEGKPLGVQLPPKVELKVEEAEPVVKGQTAASSNKPAILENGVRVMVPPFIEAGEMIVVDTNEISYVERAKS
ncbi:MAG: elongation factor P [Rickettsiales bacterium]|nr:elongation factor P [Rickettsiales bacterium]